ncbi:MAG: septal ring lytic transglycosylase RlpA family protein [Steroidobacteraceae bacterium]
MIAVLTSGCGVLSGRSHSVPRSPAPVPATPPPDLAAIPDAVPRTEPRSARGNPLMYEVFGKRYFVLATAEGYRERGVASWYGPDFHEKATSSGEPYDMYAMTAAHKTLPLPTYVRVTNLTNGRSVVVRVNDRGPFVANRIIDLSYTAAQKLDMTRAGTALVEVEALVPGSLQDVARDVAAAQQPPSLAAGALYLQAGAFGQAANAQRLVARLRDAGIDGVTLIPPDGASALHRVRVGPVPDVASFDRLADRLARLGVEARLVTP